MDQIARYIITGICIIGLIAIGYAFLNYANIPIPPLFIYIFWIVLAVIVCAGAVRIVANMWKE